MQAQPIFRPEDFKNQLDLLPLTSSEIEGQIATYPLVFPQTRDFVVERGIKFPPFVSAFYNYIYKHHRVPTQKEYYDFYLQINAVYFNSSNFSDEIYIGLMARMFRTYPSLVRDFHLNKTLSEKLIDAQVIYNSILDIKHDIDTMLVKNKRYWAVCLYTQTRRANTARGWKENRHEHFSNVEYIEFPVTLDDRCKVGEFFLYGKNEVIQLLKNIPL